jgi:hypothetical protein
VKDDELWKIFSQYIRLRDSDSTGYCICITCSRVYFWKEMQCGHGIGRQHMATKYDERNNHAQCKTCNSFEGGNEDAYKKAVDRKYGAGTWEQLELKAKTVCKMGANDFLILQGYFGAQVKLLLADKGLN